MDTLEFYRDTLFPTVQGLQLHDNPETTRSGVQLVMGTLIHESGGLVHRAQIGGGPGRGLGQIEAETESDFRENWLSFRPEYIARIAEVSGAPDPARWYGELAFNDHLAAALTRMLYFRVPEPLPRADDLFGHAAYWKDYYNTPLGKGTMARFVADIRHHAPWLYAERVLDAAEARIAGDAV